MGPRWRRGGSAPALGGNCESRLKRKNSRRAYCTIVSRSRPVVLHANPERVAPRARTRAPPGPLCSNHRQFGCVGPEYRSASSLRLARRRPWSCVSLINPKSLNRITVPKTIDRDRRNRNGEFKFQCYTRGGRSSPYLLAINGNWRQIPCRVYLYHWKLNSAKLYPHGRLYSALKFSNRECEHFADTPYASFYYLASVGFYFNTFFPASVARSRARHASEMILIALRVPYDDVDERLD